jgi:hypothetical protein
VCKRSSSVTNLVASKLNAPNTVFLYPSLARVKSWMWRKDGSEVQEEWSWRGEISWR